MPPALASLLTAALVLYLFLDEARGNATRRPALWIPVLWMTITGSRFVSQWLNLGSGESAASSAEGSPLDAVYFSTLIAAALVTLHRRRVDWGRLFRDNRLMLLFVAYGLVSIVWSDVPLVALKRWIKTLGHPLMALVILTDPDPVAAFRTVMKRCSFVLLPVSVLFIKYYPQYGRGFDSWTGQPTNNGIGLSKNDLGYLCMVFGLFHAWNIQQAWRLPARAARWKAAAPSLLMLGTAVWLLQVADSATSLATLVMGSLTLWLLTWRWLDKRRIARTLILWMVLAVAAQLMFDIYTQVVQMLGRNPTLTDRTAVWADALALQNRPWIGMGFESFWTGPRLDIIWAKWWWQPNQAHNGYIETYLNLGLLGVGILGAMLVATFLSICRSIGAGNPFAELRLAFLFAIIAFNFTEAAFKGVHLVWTLFYLIALDAPAGRPAQPARTPRPLPARRALPPRVAPHRRGPV